MSQLKLSNGILMIKVDALSRARFPLLGQPYVYVYEMSRPRSPLVECGLDLCNVGGMLIEEEQSRWMDVVGSYGSGTGGIKGATHVLSMYGYFRRRVVQYAKLAALEIAIDVMRRIGRTEIYFESDEGVKILTLLQNCSPEHGDPLS